MPNADEIEAELHRRFQDEIYVGMTNTGYLNALAKVIIRYTAEQLAISHEQSDRGLHE